MPDDFAERWRLSTVARVTVDLQNATRESWETGPSGADLGERSVWLEWEAPEDGTVRLVATERSSVPTQVRISVLQVDGTLRFLTNLPAPADWIFPAERGVQYEMAVTAPEWIRNESVGVWRRWSASATTLSISPTSPNTDPGSAIELAGDHVSVNASALGSQTGVAWWRWRAHRGGTVLVSGNWDPRSAGSYPTQVAAQVFRSRPQIGNGTLEFLGDLNFWVSQEVNESDSIYIQVTGGPHSMAEVAIHLSLSSLQLNLPQGWGSLTAGIPAQFEITGRPPGMEILKVGLESNRRWLAERSGDFEALDWIPDSSGVRRLQAILWDVSGRPWATPAVYRHIRPSNDDFQRAEPMVPNQAPISIRLQEATVEPGEPEPAEPSVWWRWTANSSERLRINTWGNSASTPVRVRVFEGDSLASLRLLPDQTPRKERPSAYDSREWETRAGVSYAVSVSGTATGARIQFLSDNFIPRNDTYESRIDLTINQPAPVPFPEFMSSTLQQTESRESWFQWTAPKDGELILRVPTSAVVYQETSVFREGPAGLELQNVLIPDWDVVWVPVVGGQSYAISVVASTLQRTNATQVFPPLMLTAEFTPAPRNARFEQRAPVEGSPGVFRGTTEGADPLGSGPELGREVWYSWIPPESGEALCWADSASDVRVSAYSGDRFSELVETEGGVGDRNRALRFGVMRGVPITIVVASGQRNAGSPFRGTIGMVGDLVSDTFDRRISLNVMPAALPADNRDATPEVQEPQGLTNSIWWSWKAPADGWLTVAAPVSITVKMFEGTSVGDLVARMSEVTLPGTRPKDRYPVHTGDVLQMAASGKSAFDLPFGIAMDFTTLAIRSPLSGTTVHSGQPFLLGLGPVDASIDGEPQDGKVYLDFALGPKPLMSLPFPAQSPSFAITNALPIGLVQITARYTNSAGTVRESWPVTVAVEPDQDGFQSGKALTGAEWQEPYLLLGATREPGEPPASANAVTGSLWWHWTAPFSGEALIQSPNGIVSVFTGASVDRLERVPILTDPTIGSAVGIQMYGGVTYHFRMEGRQQGESGRLVVRASPVTLSGARTHEVLTRERIRLQGFVDPLLGRSATLEYRLNGQRIASGVFSGVPLDPLVLPGAGRGLFQAVATLANGRSFTNLIGATVFWKESNDDPSRAAILSGTSGYDSLSTVNAGLESTDGTHEPGARSRRLWWRIQAVADGQLTVSVGLVSQQGVESTSLGIFDETRNVLLGGVGLPMATTEVRRGELYYLSATVQSDGDLSIEYLLSPRSGHDAIHEALPLASFPASLTVTFGMASVEPDEPWTSGEDVGQSLWWTFRPERSGVVLIDSPIGGLRILPLRGEDSTQAIPIGTGSQPSEGVSYFPVSAGDRYWMGLGVSQQMAWEREIRVHFVDEATNDSLAAPAVLPSGSGGRWVDLRHCTLEPGEPRHPAAVPDEVKGSVWFDWNPGRAGLAVLSAPDVQEIAVYRRMTDGTLSIVGAGHHECAFTASSEHRYLIALIVGESGPELSWFAALTEAFPGNDDFARAELLRGLRTTLRASLNLATWEPGESDLHSGSPGASVWWRWTAPVSGPVELRMPAGTSFLTRVDVYLGTSLDALARVARSNLEQTGPALWFHATAGREYRIAASLDRVPWWDAPLELLLTQLPQEPTVTSVVARDVFRLSLEFVGPMGVGSQLESSTDLVNWTGIDSGVFSGVLETLDIEISPESDPQFFRILEASKSP